MSSEAEKPKILHWRGLLAQSSSVLRAASMELFCDTGFDHVLTFS